MWLVEWRIKNKYSIIIQFSWISYAYDLTFPQIRRETIMSKLFVSEDFIAAELIDKQSIKLWRTFNFKLDIRIIGNVALVEFGGEPMIEILTSCFYSYFCDDGKSTGKRYNYSGCNMPLGIYCATEKIIAFDLLQNNSRLLEDVSQKESIGNIKNLVGSSSFPCVLRYIDDDELWGALKSISNSSRSAYIFLGYNNLHIISNILYVFVRLICCLIKEWK
jgi:hypothetical protein